MQSSTVNKSNNLDFLIDGYYASKVIVRKCRDPKSPLHGQYMSLVHNTHLYRSGKIDQNEYVAKPFDQRSVDKIHPDVLKDLMENSIGIYCAVRDFIRSKTLFFNKLDSLKLFMDGRALPQSMIKSLKSGRYQNIYKIFAANTFLYKSGKIDVETYVKTPFTSRFAQISKDKMESLMNQDLFRFYTLVRDRHCADEQFMRSL